MLDAGADLLQVYSGFVTRGPSLPGRLSRLVR
jgi:dihydroorotate dehydrogenase